jgi:hypothetical protein
VFIQLPPGLNIALLLLFFFLVLPAALYWLARLACGPARPPDPPGVHWCDECRDDHGPVKDL